MQWTVENIPDLSGKTAIVTGANSGLGFEITKALAAQGCVVIMACRSAEKAREAKTALLTMLPNARLVIAPVDLSSLQSINNFCTHVKALYPSISLLINNAAILNTDVHQKTTEGFGIIMGTNHLGTFALTAGLLPLLAADGSARIVTVSSDSHRFAGLSLNDLEADETSSLKMYAKSKLANLLFAFELDRRLKSAHLPIFSVAAHPGVATSHLSDVKATGSNWFARIAHLLTGPLAQTSAQGALPILYAATAPDVNGGEYYGPDGFGNLNGFPKRLKASNTTYNAELASQLWARSEKLLGLSCLSASSTIAMGCSSTSRALKLLHEAAPRLNIKPFQPSSKYLFQGDPIEIKAHSDTVWKVITDIAHYQDYSKGAIHAHLDEGELAPTKGISVQLYPNKGFTKLLPATHLRITAVDEDSKILGWSFQLPFGLGYTQRYHILENLGDNKVRSHIMDHVPGIVGFFTNLLLGSKIKSAFNELNQGFKEKAEFLEQNRLLRS